MSRFKKNLVFFVLYILLVSSFVQFGLNARVLNFSPYFFAVLTTAVILVILTPTLKRWLLLAALGLTVILYVALWFVLGGRLTGEAFSILALELVLLVTGIMLAREITVSFGETEQTIDKLIFATFSGRALLFDEASKVIQTELARSRRYNRPLSLVIIEPDPDAVGADIQSAMLLSGSAAGKELQKQLARRYVMAQIAEILDKEARNTDLIVKQDNPDRFIILCPETQTSNTNTLIRRVVEKTRAQVGAQVGFGVAAFPEEAMTFEELLQKAEAKMVKPGAFSVGK